MATHFLPLSKNVSCTFTPKGRHLCRIPWESVKNWGSSSRRKISPHFLPIIYGYHGNTLSATVKNCVLHIYTARFSRQTSVPNCHENSMVKNWRSSSRRKIFPNFLPIICSYHGNTLSTTVKKYVLHMYTPRQTSLLNSMRISQKLRKYSSRRKIFHFFAHNMLLPWQRTFCHCRKMCLAHLHPKTNICAKFHENRSKTEEVVRDARFSPIFCP